MPRRARKAPGGIVYHVLNRAAGRLTLFRTDADYAAFERVLAEALARNPGVRLLDYCLMPNHWHLVLWPRGDGELSAFMFWLTMTHTQRWRHARGKVGEGPLYQGRFKSFPVQADGHLLTVCRYAVRNPLRAGLVRRAERWRWSGFSARLDDSGTAEAAARRAMLRPWPVDEPPDWPRYVNEAQTDAELEAAELAALRTCVARGRPFGGERWQRDVTSRLGLESSYRPPGRPRKPESEPEAGKESRPDTRKNKPRRRPVRGG